MQSSSTYPEVNRLSQLSSRTLSLVLERQRLASFSPGGSLPASQLTQISRNLVQLRSGIIEQEALGYGVREAVKPVRQQWMRMRAMLGEEGLSIDKYGRRMFGGSLDDSTDRCYFAAVFRYLLRYRHPRNHPC